MKIESTHRTEWSEEECGYVPTQELIGYQAVSADGRIWGYGETPQEALNTGLEAFWLEPAARGK